ncbi:putative membrane protein [Escherichia coli 3-020-07_S3_C1]|nr:putative membrane protein [Escherichia coli 2-460-02_S4_C2]KDY72122.1 putative membrane protein [Escherichia coli 2-460-02_S4_C3]KDZ32263.1 putative membrane protein [Escherichia coli 3-020-07_S3_C1]KEJ54404.1 putative membrane protein [Escherichia coli 3-020-07_S3_C2]
MCDNALINDVMSCKPMLIDYKLIIFVFFCSYLRALSGSI